MEEQEKRVAENEARFRLVNERIREMVSRDSAPEDPAERIGVVCECGHADCAATVHVPLAVYEWTRQASARFVIAEGHELPEFERVVREGEGFGIVEKTGEAKQLAADADPRN